MPFESTPTSSGDHEFDPVGTIVLLAVYFVVLVLAWLYMYFIEFLGNDPSVIGVIGL